MSGFYTYLIIIFVLEDTPICPIVPPIMAMWLQWQRRKLHENLKPRHVFSWLSNVNSTYQLHIIDSFCNFCFPLYWFNISIVFLAPLQLISYFLLLIVMVGNLVFSFPCIFLLRWSPCNIKFTISAILRVVIQCFCYKYIHDVVKISVQIPG